MAASEVARPRRSLLYVPGHRESMIARAGERGADTLILNLEDAVSDADKDLARATVVRALREMSFGGAEVVVRTNAIATGAGYRDLLEIVPAAPNAILLPKVASAEEARFAAWTIERLEWMHDMPSGAISLMCMVETAAGVIAADGIAAAHPRLRALVFGAADFSTDVGCVLTPDGRSLLYATSRVITAARAAGIDAIDAPHMRVGDPGGMEQAARLARELGFTGKSAIHPGQVAVINQAFSPAPEEIDWARRVVEMLEGELHTGAALLDGQLIELPHLHRARRILAAAGSA